MNYLLTCKNAIDRKVKRLYYKGMLSVIDKILYPIRKAVARVTARKRLRRLFTDKQRIYVTADEFKRLVESLSETMCETGIFKPRRIKNFKRQFCNHCMYKMNGEYGHWCYIKDCYMEAIKDEYCGAYTEKRKDVATLRK
jgi:hypothetical protein